MSILNKIKSKTGTNIVIFVLSVASLYFIYSSLNEPFYIVSKEISSLSWGKMIFSLCLLVVTMLLKAVVHEIIFKHYQSGEKEVFSAENVMECYLLSQIIRYIPGKVIGITAQSIKLTGKAASKNVWVSNLLQYIVTNYNAVIIISFFVVALAYKQTILVYVGLVFSFSIYVLLNKWWVILKLFRVIKEKLQENLHWDVKKTCIIWCLLQLEWLFFLSGIALLTPDASITHNALILGLLYSFSSIVASLTIVMPAGILIRESVFIWTSSQFGFDPAVLLFLGVMIRIALSLADIFAYIFFYQYKIIYERYKRQ